MHDYGAVFERAGKQHGLITRGEARRLGVTANALLRLERSKQIVRISERVWRIAGSPKSWTQTALAACLANGATARACLQSAAALHGFTGYKRAGVVHIAVSRSAKPFAIGRVHRYRDLPDANAVRVDSVPVTSAARTIIDLAAVVGVADLRRVIDDGARRNLVTIDDLDQEFERVRRRGRTGISVIRAVLEDPSTRGVDADVIERLFLSIVQSAGLPMPTLQHPLRRTDGREAFIDVAYPELHLAIELDGHGCHATRSERASDHLRGNELVSLGWRLLRFTYEQLIDSPAVVIRQLRTVFQSAAA